MKSVFYLVLFVTVAAWVNSGSAHAQDSLQSNNRIVEVSLNFGGGTFRNSHFSYDELKRFYPESSILDQMSGAGVDYYDSEANGFSGVQLTMGVFSNHPRYLNARHLTGWRFGISYQQFNLLNYSSYDEFSDRQDTLYNQNGNVIGYMDSIFYYDRKLKLQSGIIALESAYLIRFNGFKRWSYFLGIGISGGMTVRNEMLLRQDMYSGTKTYDLLNGSEYSWSQKKDNSYLSEIKQMSSDVAIGGFIPFGLDFKFTRKQRGFDFMHLFIEGRSGIHFIKMKGLRTSVGTTMLLSLGIRTIL